MSNYDKNDLTNKRPLSPHLTIYKPQITSMLSISHRLTGVLLSIGVLVFSWWLVLVINGCGSCIKAITHNEYFKYILILWSLFFFYHFSNGIRHLFWDIGKGFEIKTVYRTGWLVILSSLILTAVTWYIALN